MALFVAQLVFWVPARDHAPTMDSVRFVVSDDRVRTGDLGAIFGTDWWNHEAMGAAPNDAARGGLYRPITLWWMSTHFVEPLPSRTEPVGQELQDANRVLHALAVVLVFLLGFELLGRTGAAALGAGLAAMVIGVHPVAVETLGTGVGAADALAAVFSLAALWILARPMGPRWLPPLLTGLFAVLAMLSKEHAIALPAIAFLQLLWAQGRSAKDALKVVWPIFAAAAAALGLRFAVLGSLSDPGDPVLALFPFGARLATALAVIGGPVLQTLFWPVGLNPLLGLQDVAPAASLMDPRALTGLCVLLALVAAIAEGVRRKNALAYGCAFFLLAWLPVSNLIIPIGALGATRFLYMPAFGLALVLALGISFLAHAAKHRALVIAVPLALALAIPFGWQSRIELSAWKTNETLFETAAKNWPNSVMLRHHLVRAALDRAEAIPEQKPERKAAFIAVLEEIDRALALPLPSVPGRPDYVQEDLLEVRFNLAMNIAAAASRLQGQAARENDAASVQIWRERALDGLRRAIDEAERGRALHAQGQGETPWPRWYAEAHLRRVEILAQESPKTEAEKNRQRQVFEAQFTRARAAAPDHLGVDLAEARLLAIRGDSVGYRRRLEAIYSEARKSPPARLGRSDVVLSWYDFLIQQEKFLRTELQAQKDEPTRQRLDAERRATGELAAEVFLSHFEEGLWRESPRGPSAVRLAEHGLVGLSSRHPSVQDAARKAIELAHQRRAELPREAIAVIERARMSVNLRR